MTIKTKFDIGDKVFLKIRKDEGSKYKKCSLCNGKRKVKINKKYYQCPKCLGKGKIEINVYKKHVIETEIYGINIEIDKLKIINYSLHGRFSRIFEQYLYKTYAGASKSKDYAL